MSLPFVIIYGSKKGTGFFAAPEYIVTCHHLLEEYAAGEKVKFKFDNEKEIHEAEIVDILEDDDLALLKSTVAIEKHYVLDRVAVKGKEAHLKGYSHNSEHFRPVPVKIGELDGENNIVLEEANGATVGYSGGPIYVDNDENTAVGVYRRYTKADKDGHMQEIAYAVPASVILDTWGEYVCEKRYQPQRKNLHKENDFVYQALKTDFTGRDAEIELLNRFVQHNDSPLLWQAVVAEGGSGKSRLAYEFAHSLDSTWHCELVTQADLTVSKLNRIYEEAGRNLLLIADYAYTDTNELGDWIENILTGMPEHDIRILMLQRQGNDPNNKSKWLESLEKKLGNVNDYMFEPEITINRLSKDDIYIVMESYAQSKGKTLDGKECAALYEALERVDPELLRPLFAMFITDAYLEDHDRPLNWKREEALKHFCERERVEINKAVSEDCQDAAQLLTVLATITGGYSFKKRELPDFDAFEATENIGYKLQKAGIAVKADKEYTVDAITPDILGEYFVKMYLETHFNDIPDILNAAQEHKPSETADFLLRLFTDHEADLDFIEKCCNNYINAFSVSSGLVNRADKDKLAAMYERSKDSEIKSLLCVQYAKGLVNYLYDLTDSAEAKGILAELKSLHETAHNDEVTVEYAKGLVNYLKNQTDSEESKKSLAELKSLHETAHNDEVTVWYASGLVNYIGKFSDSAEAKGILAELKILHKTAHNDEVTVLYANGLVNYIGKFSDSAEAKGILAELKILHETANNDEVTVWYASGLFNYLYYLTDSEESKKSLAELKSLHETAHNDEVTVIYAKGLVNYLYDLTDSAEAKGILAELKSLHETAHNDEVTVWYAKGLVNYLCDLTDSAEAKGILAELKTLHETAHNDEVTLEYAKGLCAYIQNHTASKAEAAEYLSAADSLLEESPENKELEGMCMGVRLAALIKFGIL